MTIGGYFFLTENRDLSNTSTSAFPWLEVTHAAADTPAKYRPWAAHQLCGVKSAYVIPQLMGPERVVCPL